MPELTVRDHMVLRLAGARYRYPGARESDMHELVGMSPALFWRHVGHLIDRPEALAADPVLVHRLRRLRDQRQRQRSTGRLVRVAQGPWG